MMLQQHKGVRAGELALLAVLISLAITVVPALAAAGSVLLSANRIHLDQARKQMVYSGSVRLRRDGLVIEGSRAVATTSATGSKEIVITGNPVRASFTSPGGERIELTSLRLAYESDNELIRANERVVLANQDGVIKGDRIEYALTTNRFSVYGANEQSRVSALFSAPQAKPVPDKP